MISQRRYLEDRGQYLKAKAVYQHVREKLLNMGLTRTDLRELIQGQHLEGHRYVLKAPLDGIVTSQQVVLVKGVAPGHELFQIVDTSQVWVFANLPVEQIRRFKIGDHGTVVPKGRDSIDAVLSYIGPDRGKSHVNLSTSV